MLLALRKSPAPRQSRLLTSVPCQSACNVGVNICISRPLMTARHTCTAPPHPSSCSGLTADQCHLLETPFRHACTGG